MFYDETVRTLIIKTFIERSVCVGIVDIHNITSRM